MTSRQNIKLSAAQRLVMQPLTDAAMREALDEFELVCENNDVRKLTDAEKYAAQEFALSLVHGDPSGAPAAEAEPTDKLAPTLILTGAQLLEALDLVAPDRTADQFESEVSFQYGNGHSGKGMYCWITDYPDEGASLLDGSTVSAQAVAADGAQLDQQAAMEAGWAKHSGKPWYGGLGVTRGTWEEAWRQGAGWMESRAAVSPATYPLHEIQKLLREVDPKWRERSEFGVKPLGQILCAIRDLAAAVSPAAAEPCAHDYVRSDRVCTECGEKTATADERSAFDYDDVVSICDAHGIGLPVECIEMVVEIVKHAELRASQAAAPAEAREHDVPEIIAASNRGYAAGLRDGKALGACGPLAADAGEAVALTAAARDVLAERARQVSVEGWTPEHDDQYTKGELALAASQYVLHVACPFQDGKVPAFWPWPAEWWKPTTPRRDLEKAGALIQAEIERLYRAEAREQGAQGGKGGE